MYDPVTARFLQVDTYSGNQNDPLSLNFYTYCLNNPHKYVDPSGHFAITITAATVLLIARIGVALISGIVSAKGEYDRQVEEGDNYTNWGSVIFVGIANAGISYFTFGLGQGAAAVAGTGAKAVLKHIGKAVVRDVALGAVADMGVETTRQLITGTKITNLEYDRIAEAGVYGGIAGGASSLAGAGLESFMQTRVAQKAIVKLNEMANKGADAIQNAFRKVTKKSGTTVGLEDITGKKEPMLKMNLQFFASDEAYQTSYGKSSGNIVNKHKGWKVGDPIDKLTKDGKEPSWSTVKARYWKNEAYYNPNMYSSKNLDLMGKGKAPRHNMIDVPQELHHINGRNIDNPHNIDNLMPVWPWEHAEIDPYRYYKGPRP